MPTTSRLSLRYPSTSDTADVPRDIGNLASDIDNAAIFSKGTFSARPTSTVGSPGIDGRYYFATDTSRLYLDTGTSWVEVASGNDSVSSAMIAADAVGSSEIAANAVGSSELADNAVDTAAIANSAVTFAKLGWPTKTALASTPAEFSTSSGSATDVTGASISVSETAGGFTIVKHSCQLKSTGGSGEAYSWIHSDSSVGSVGSNAIGTSLGAPGVNTAATPRTKVVSGTYTWVGSSAVAPCPTTRTTTYKVQISAGVNPSAFIKNVTLTAWTFTP